MKAIVLTCDRYRAITEHMILKYDQLWPDHPFVFRIPCQELGGTPTNRCEYIKTPSPIRATALQLIADLEDDEWIYWCVDDKYPIELALPKIRMFVTGIQDLADASGLLFCRSKALLRRADETLFPGERQNSAGDILLERRGWNQIWIHQLLRVKVIRYLFSKMPEQIESAKLMDHFKDEIPKPPELRLYVTKENFAVFGESTHKGTINQNCYDSIVKTNIELPKWFRRPNGKSVIIGKLEAGDQPS
ncbi:MAG TPA: hypothetical protein VKS98_11570 [Chthoniobacterales bacterium]|nr:hypothetical protein [Chthoniobacterales bacterium]